MLSFCFFFFFKQKTAYEMRISDWSADVCSSDLPTMDPPTHTNHRALLMSLITPKRLKENEEFMWKLADQQIATFIDKGECEMMGAFAQPFAVLVVSDLLGVPAEDRIKFRQQLIRQEREGATLGGTEDRSEEHTSELQSLMRIQY